MFGGVKLTKNADPYKHSYNDYGIGFNTHGKYFSPDGRVGKNVIIFGVNMSLSVHIDNKRKYILIHYKGKTQGLNHTSVSETQYLINFIRSSIKFCLSLHYNSSKSFLFVNATKIYQLKTKNSDNNMEKTRLNRYMYNFSVYIFFILVILSISINI